MSNEITTNKRKTIRVCYCTDLTIEVIDKIFKWKCIHPDMSYEVRDDNSLYISLDMYKAEPEYEAEEILIRYKRDLINAIEYLRDLKKYLALLKEE